MATCCSRKSFALLDLLVAAALGYCSFMWLHAAKSDDGVLHVSAAISGFYLALGALAVLLSGLVRSAALSYYARFTYTFAGKGLLFIGLGGLCLQDDNAKASIVLGASVIAAGFLYLLLQCVSSLGAPEPLICLGPSALEPLTAAQQPAALQPAPPARKAAWPSSAERRRASSQSIAAADAEEGGGALGDAWLPPAPVHAADTHTSANPWAEESRHAMGPM